MLLQWSHVFSDMVRLEGLGQDMCGYLASMEPCLFRHGKATYGPHLEYAAEPLQWSHVFSDMVSLEMKLVVNPTITASMEPCLFRHGKRRRHRQQRREHHRFNGAMSFQTW